MIQLKDLINKLQKYFEVKSNIELVYLFGSAQIRQNPNDIDIGILLKEKMSDLEYSKEKLKFISDLIDILKFNNIDIVILNNTDDILLLYKIVVEGKLVYATDFFTHTRYKAKIMSFYLDFQYILEKQKQNLIKKYG